jgi:hypothetical protein
MYVSVGATAALRIEERRRFLDTDWPRIRALIVRLGLSAEELLQPPAATPAPATPAPAATPPPATTLTPGTADNKDESDGHDH